MQELVDASLVRLREYPDVMKRLLAGLREKNSAGGKIEPWKEDQLNRFGVILASNAGELERAFSEENDCKTAWVARNILELSVWVRYCNLSDEHAKRFRLDAARDILRIFEAFKKLHFDKIKNDLPRMDKAAHEMEAVAQNEFGVPTLGTTYERVAKAAVEVGEGAFENLNKLFSKFAHPTAWVIGSMYFEDFENFRKMFLIEGTMLANMVLDEIRTFVLKHYPITVP